MEDNFSYAKNEQKLWLKWKDQHVYFFYYDEDADRVTVRLENGELYEYKIDGRNPEGRKQLYWDKPT